MTNYSLTANGQEYPIRIVGNQTWGGTQQTIVYESPGTNGGVVVVTGRTNNSITLTGRLLPPAGSVNPLIDLNSEKSKFQRLKDAGTPVVLVAPIDNDDTGVYLITEFSGNLPEGICTYLAFTMTLTEYRQANLKRTLVNLISYEPAEEFKRILVERNIELT